MLEGSEVFNFDEGQFLFSFVLFAFFWCLKKSLLIRAPVFPSELIVFALTFRCLIHFELICTIEK